MNKKAINAEYIKQYNRRKILNLLSKEPLSRAELARRTGLTRAAISIIVDELLSYHILIEHSVVAQKRGRSPAPLTLNPDNFCAIGIYLNRHSCLIGLVDITGTCQCIANVPFAKDKPVSVVLDDISGEIRRILLDFPVVGEKLLGIGISVPGPIDLQNGMILNPPNFELWHNTAICEELKKRLHYPVYFADNADSLAIYNMRYGDMKNCTDFMLLLVDSGVGSGIVSNGLLHHGINNMSSEIGHISIQHRGKPCSCGNTGCLEVYAAIPNILEDSGNYYSSWKDVMDAVELNIDEAKQILSTESEYLAAAITSVINLFNLNTIVFAGDVLYHFPVLEKILMKDLTKRTLLKDSSSIRIVASDTREDYHTISAANIVFTVHLDS